jgi:hypothetical protein
MKEFVILEMPLLIASAPTQKSVAEMHAGGREQRAQVGSPGAVHADDEQGMGVAHGTACTGAGSDSLVFGPHRKTSPQLSA